MPHRALTLSRALAHLQPPQQRQVGALCWRRGENGLRVLLVTTRRTSRWTPPKGGEMEGLSRAASAAEEAWEEAGVRGRVADAPIGSYRYLKFLGEGRWERRVVDLFPLEVEEVRDDFPEAGERRRRWFRRKDAARAVDERALRRLIRDFDPGA